jgi:hypothetical protein
VRTRSNPNAASSVPPHLAITVPALGILGAAILALTTVGAGRLAARRFGRTDTSR